MTLRFSAQLPNAPAVLRPRLIAGLDDLARKRLGLVVAPAGYGKSTLLAQFTAAWPGLAIPCVVDAADVGRGEFLGALARAVDLACAHPVGITAWSSVEDVVHGLAALVHEHPRGVVLVLDDLHRLEGSEAQTELELLIGCLPEGAHLLAGSRRSPGIDLSRLRVADELVELSADDLRFRSWEIEELFSSLYAMWLPPQELGRLGRVTDGWAAGLQLFRLAAAGKTDHERTTELERLSHSRAHTVHDYLTRNVLAGLHPQLRRFLIDTSVLGHLTARVCDELLGIDDSHARLEALVQQQVFTTVVGEGRYRYHEVLRGHLELMLAGELTGAALKARYAHAAQVLEAHGAPGDALRAYFCADDHDGARRVLSLAGFELSPDYDRWMDRLPVGLFAHDAALQLVVARRLLREGRPVDALNAYGALVAASSDTEARHLAQREAERVAQWTSGRPRPIDPTDWLSVLRGALRHDPGAARLSYGQLGGVGATAGAAFAALLDGELQLAIDGFQVALAATPTGMLSETLSAARALALWLLHDSDPAPVLSRIRDRCDQLGQQWIARIIRAALLAFPLRNDPPLELLILEVDKAANDCGDPWSSAVAGLFIGLGSALRTDHPLPDHTVLDRLRESADGFDTLGADVLGAWARSLGALLAVARDPDVDGARAAATASVRAADATRAAFPAAVARRALSLVDATPATDDHSVDGPSARLVLRVLSRRSQAGLARTVRTALSPAAGEPRPAAPSASGLHVRCFGAFSLSIDDKALELRTLKPRAQSVLRLLSSRAGDWVHREALIDALWSGADAVAATKSLHVSLSAIRQLLGSHSGHLERNGETYRLAGVTAHDRGRFVHALQDAAAARARQDRRVELDRLGDALELSRGRLLAEEGAAMWAVAEREQVERLEVEACARIAQLLLDDGDHAGATAALERALLIDRYDDKLWTLLEHTALAGGNDAAASRARQRYGEVLRELGIDLRPPEALVDPVDPVPWSPSSAERQQSRRVSVETAR